MLTLQVPIGAQSFTVSGDDLSEVLKNASELQTISKRLRPSFPTKGGPSLHHRESGGHHFYEALVYLGKEMGVAKKQLGNSDGSLFLAANEPWRRYDKETETEFVRFDYLTDDVKSWGFDETATKGWVAATNAKKGKLRVYKPV